MPRATLLQTEDLILYTYSMDLSIIIVSYNTSQITKDCIESVVLSLKNSKLKYEIVVIDNDSSDDSVEQLKILKTKYRQIQLLESGKNIGFGPANNQCVKKVKGEYILLLNSDTVVLNDAIEKLLEFTKSNPDAHFVGGKLLNSNRTSQASAAPFYSLPIVFAALFLKGDYWGLTRSSPNTTRKVDWVSGACILTKKTNFEKLGGFDEDVFLYMEEVDLLYRAKKMGFNTYFFPEAQFIHIGFASSGNRSKPIIQVFKGFMYLYKKHHSRTSQFVLKTMLQLKVAVSLFIGRVTKNQYLVNTYEEAKTLTKQ